MDCMLSVSGQGGAGCGERSQRQRSSESSGNENNNMPASGQGVFPIDISCLRPGREPLRGSGQAGIARSPARL